MLVLHLETRLLEDLKSAQHSYRDAIDSASPSFTVWTADGCNYLLFLNTALISVNDDSVIQQEVPSMGKQ